MGEVCGSVGSGGSEVMQFIDVGPKSVHPTHSAITVITLSDIKSRMGHRASSDSQSNCDGVGVGGGARTGIGRAQMADFLLHVFSRGGATETTMEIVNQTNVFQQMAEANI